MKEPYMCNIKRIYPQLDNALQFKINRVKQIEDFLIAEINDREKTLNKYIIVFNYSDKTLLVLPDTGSGVSLFSSITVIGTPIGIASASISLVFLLTNGIVKMFLQTLGKKQI